MEHSNGLQIGRRRGSLPPIRGLIGTQVALIAFVVALCVAGRAEAGTMYVYSCHTPAGKPAGIAGWTSVATDPDTLTSSNCAAGPTGVLLARSIGRANASDDNVHTASWDFTAADGTTIVGFAASVCPRAATGYAQVEWLAGEGPDEFFTLWGNGLRPSTMACYGVAPYWADPRNTVQRHGLVYGWRVRVRSTCFQCVGVRSFASLELSSFQAIVQDDSRPAVGRVRGTLLDNAVHRGVERVEFNASDVGVGVYRAVAEARSFGQGAWRQLAVAPIGASRPSCRELDAGPSPFEFDDPQPCPLDVRDARLDLDTGLLPPGQHEFRVALEDASGNRATVIPARPFTVTSPPPPPRAVSLQLAEKPNLVMRRGAGLRITGKLSDLAGEPIGGIPLAIRTRTYFPKAAVARGEWTAHTAVVTDAGGNFTARLPPGESRTVQVAVADAPGLANASAQVDVSVRADVAAKARATRISNGRSAVVTGRVAGPIPKGGVPVALEVREKRRWIPVATTRRWVRTTNTGRFKLAYRFRRTFEPATYRFRVVADEDSSFAYTRGASRVITVRVRP